MSYIDWILERNLELRGQFLDSSCPIDPEPPPTFSCPFCPVVLASKAELLRHTRTGHPLELPLLLLDGRPARTEEVFRSTFDPADIDLANCTRIEIAIGAGRFQEVDKPQLDEVLRRQSGSMARIRLTNERSNDQMQAERVHRLIFRIAPLDELRAIEASFISSMQDLPISVSAARTFWETAREFWNHAASGEYANALSNYLIGLAIKQGDPEANHLGFERFKYKLMEASAVLRQLDLPLACGLTGIICLNLNDFGDWRSKATAFPGLQAAGTFFHNPGEALGGERRKPRSAIGTMSQCPVDDLTERIVEATLMILEGRASTPALQSLLPPLLKWSPLSEYDRQKLHVLMAATHLANGCIQSATPHLRSLRADVNFGGWAAGVFER